MVIILNSFLVGFDVQWRTTHYTQDKGTEIAGHLCSVFFLVEVALRIYTYRWSFIFGETRSWNVFDFLLVVFSFVDVALTYSNSKAGSNTSLGQGMKTLKMLRIIRVFRVFRFFKELSLLALMIADSMKSLIWALLMLAIIIYVFAIFFTEAATDYIRQHASSEVPPKGLSEVYRIFGSFDRTIYSLIQALLGGINWGVIADALLTIDWTSALLFLFYIFFSMIAVLNIITGVFVDNAVETSKMERDYLVQKQIELKEKYLQEMRQLFSDMDRDASGSISLEEVKAYVEDPRVHAYLQVLGLEADDAEKLFRLLDTSGSESVSVDEFLEGCMRLKGAARSIDMQQLLAEYKRSANKLDDLEKRFKAAFPNFTVERSGSHSQSLASMARQDPGRLH